MAKSKEDIKYGAAQAKLSEDEAMRIRYKAGTPLEGGKIADSQPLDLFSGARNISNHQRNGEGNIAESEPVDIFSIAHGIEKQKQREDDRQGSGEQYQLRR